MRSKALLEELLVFNRRCGSSQLFRSDSAIWTQLYEKCVCVC